MNSPAPSLVLAVAVGLSVWLSPVSAQGQQTRKTEVFKAWKHLYWEREAVHGDACSILLRKVKNGEATLETTSMEAFLRSLLAMLDIPASSQLLVYSATSVQAGVHPKNPRAIYFNEEVYVAMVPGTGVEAMGMDPDFGAVFYEFGHPSLGAQISTKPSGNCFGCHSNQNSQHLPGLVIESLVKHPGHTLPEKFRNNSPGHEVPLESRFGGWYVTSARPIGPTKEGLVAAGRPGEMPLRVRHLTPAQRHDPREYPVPTSDIVAHLVHEHQSGFHNLVMQAGFLCRDITADDGVSVSAKNEARLEAKADQVVRYILFADEAALPEGGVEGDPQFVRDFQRNRRPGPRGAALKDFDLRSRIFKHRCSYMVHSPHWERLPALIKSRLYARMKAALTGADPAYSYLPLGERQTILEILRATLTDLPADWR